MTAQSSPSRHRSDKPFAPAQRSSSTGRDAVRSAAVSWTRPPRAGPRSTAVSSNVAYGPSMTSDPVRAEGRSVPNTARAATTVTTLSTASTAPGSRREVTTEIQPAFRTG